ncbi:MAG: FAD-dependent oxidoreductase [Hamadaea sp.]|nr:FAD-dependent oxidoreductase [Hamadaea sp.]
MAVAVIIGGGFGGVVAARELIRTGWSAIIVDPHAQPGRGVAYATPSAWHLLNSPVSAMSVDPQRPDDFLDWCRRRDPHVGPGDFVSRGWYGDYLTEALRAADDLAPGRLTVQRGHVGRVFEAAHGGMTVLLSDGVVLTADAVVLAIGAARPAHPAPVTDEVRRLPAYIGDPWRPDALTAVPDGPVLLIGTGLTAVDVALSLARAGRGPVTAVSRHGLLPAAHAPSVRQDLVPPAATRVSVLLRWVRDQAATGDWRGVLDGLRPQWDPMWQRLPEHEQRRFLRHLARYWEVHRHRMAPQVAAEVAALRARGTLTVRTGELRELRALPDGRIEAVLATGRHTFAAVVNCTGPGRLGETDPLARSMIADGLARVGPHGLGLEVDEHGAVLGRGHRPPAVYALGAARRGRLWETTAAPEIRAQARALADHLAFPAAAGALPATSDHGPRYASQP